MALMSIATTALSPQKPRPNPPRPLGELPRAHRLVETRLPQRLELRIGERRSFRGVTAAGTLHGDIVGVHVADGVLTIQGIAEGAAEIVLVGGESPSNLAVTVRRLEA